MKSNYFGRFHFWKFIHRSSFCCNQHLTASKGNITSLYVSPGSSTDVKSMSRKLSQNLSETPDTNT